MRDVEHGAGRDRPRAAEPVAASGAGDVGLLAAEAVRRPGGQARRAVRHHPRLQRPGAGQADLRQHRRRPVPAGPVGQGAAACSCCTSAPIRKPAGAPAPTPTTRTATDDGGDDRTLEDTRLILVTDLGFIVKRAKDGSRDVFVQSIRSGAAGRRRARRSGRQQRPAGARRDDRRHRPRAAAGAAARARPRARRRR